MAEKPGPKPMEINPEEVYKLAQIGSTNKELADWFNCSTDTIERRFAAELHKGRSNLKMSLRRWQLEAAKKGNVAMMIWLGKQMLGQVEKTEFTINDKHKLDVLKTLEGKTNEELIDMAKKAISHRVPHT